VVAITIAIAIMACPRDIRPVTTVINTIVVAV
jgi:hypothetical protein